MTRSPRIAFIKARWHADVVDRAHDGFVAEAAGLMPGAQIEAWDVPGAFEMPLVAQKVARSGKADAIICVGAVIRGATPHFDYVCSEATKGIAHVSMDTGVPIGFGLLTTDTLEQSIERAGSKGGNKGVEAAAAALETLRVLQQV